MLHTRLHKRLRYFTIDTLQHINRCIVLSAVIFLPMGTIWYPYRSITNQNDGNIVLYFKVTWSISLYEKHKVCNYLIIIFKKHFNSQAHIAFDEIRWTELVDNLESKRADWGNSDCKDKESDENSD